MLKKLKKLGFTAMVFALNAPVALAARPPIIPPDENGDPAGKLKIPTIPQGSAPPEQYFSGLLLPTITKTVIAAAGAVSVLFIIIAGIEMLTAYGSDDRLGTAKKTITYALVGLLISILSYAIVSIISSINLN